MTTKIILQVILLGISLAMDAFAVSIVDGLIYQDINKKRTVFIALMFGLMQMLMPIIGYFLIEIVTTAVGNTAGKEAGDILSLVITWLSFAILVFIGGKMIYEGISDLNKPRENQLKNFSYKEVMWFSVVTSIDALASGVALHATDTSGASISNNATIWLHGSIILVITFALSLVGVTLGSVFEKLLKGRISITNIIGGSILLILAIWCVLQHYVSF